ncbi:hypothetical protein K490DRAFT_69332 [Saccharata proteae CBS 121410]|uniref:C2 domain-containing protein n=1 Tax=Saccharata proteae CBS 121410 TaxID=1314787 RepID=A0A9P4HNQ2_9PEZI|nr:hypothetical protein K490DRAFT_69332 [Saccharata proteae CBS 121410]
MATKLAKPGAISGMPHTSGIYSDMTVDGPVIGTLVMVVDRAKNLPNRKTMGKQDPYCAARLAKEAKKTETDKRGGQTPRWDQELRFTVRDSPDYYQLKVSIFNDDKKTDLIGEAWVSLEAVVVPGGGQSDTWHNLNCKGKYAGEIRLELTYYDTRPQDQVEPPAEAARRDSGRHMSGDVHGSLGGPRDLTPVKRRPLPNGPASASPSPAMMPDPRAVPIPERGPRSYHTPPHSRQLRSRRSIDRTSSYAYSQEALTQPEPEDMGYAQPYAVQPPSGHGRHRSMAPQQNHFGTPTAPGRRPQSYMDLPHSHSAPVIPSYNSMPEDYPPEIEFHNAYVPYGAAYRTPISAMQPTVEDEDDAPPPPPPVHRSSAPSAVPTAAPHPVEMPDTFMAMDGSPHMYGYQTHDDYPQERRYTAAHPMDLSRRPLSRGDPYGIPAPLVPGAGSRGAAQQHRMSVSGYPSSNTYATAGAYDYSSRQYSPGQQYHTPPNYPPSRPHQLYHHESAPVYPTSRPYQTQDAAPMIKPRAVSPARPTVDTRLPRMPNRSTPTRKSVSPRPTTASSNGSHHHLPSSTPFSPDDFSAFNPRASSIHSGASSNPHSPYISSVRPADGLQQRDLDLHPRDEQGNILHQDGRKVDPSDHLPVDSWAPEPEPKGKDRDRIRVTPIRASLTGARDPGSNASSRGFNSQGRGDRALRDAVSTTFGTPSPADGGHRQSHRLIVSTKAHHGHQSGSPYGGSPGSYAGQGAPPIPAKVPLGDGMGAEDLVALSEELKGIDLGPNEGGRGGRRARIRGRLGF